MDWLSSSISVSQALMSFSMCASLSFGMFSFSMMRSSRSKILTANQRCRSSGMSCSTTSSMCASACSMLPAKRCCGMVFLPLRASCTARCAASITPSPLSAEISITGTPRWLESFAASMRSPFLRTTSIMFSATTIGIPSSASCVVRYRLRSRLVASMMLSSASGRWSISTLRATTSSIVYGLRE